jgi:hypothetical protein
VPFAMLVSSNALYPEIEILLSVVRQIELMIDLPPANLYITADDVLLAPLHVYRSDKLPQNWRDDRQCFL